MKSNSVEKSMGPERIQSFPPVSNEFSHTLILGSMPGIQSLTQHQYYAHPKNAFWPIVQQLTEANSILDYEKRIELLKSRGIALWDVLHSCIRPGSLDSEIELSSVRANDFPDFFNRHMNIRHIFFNGAYAEAAYRKHVLPILGSEYRHLIYKRLPSTSPAHASLPFHDKLELWRVITES